MSEEEKEGIKLIQGDIEDLLNDIENHKDYQNILEKEQIKLRKAVLNLIDKLQKENEEYHRIKKELIRVNKKIYDVDTIDEFIETIDKLQKVIDLMVEDIYDNDNFWKLKCAFEKIEKGKEKDYIKERFFKKVEGGNVED